MTCAVCHTENSHLAVVCKRCGGYLQTKVENLDLFATVWGIVERPGATFHTIAVAQHKNYAILLSALSGFAIVFFLFWYIKAGEFTDSLLNILAAGIATGPLAGILSVLVCSLLVKAATSFSSSTMSFGQIYAVTSYALVPVIATVVLFLPIELMTFGLYFFTKNPSPFLLRPTSYVLLTGLDTVFFLWSVILFAVGWRTVLRASWIRIIFIMAASLGVFALGIVLVVARFTPGI